MEVDYLMLITFQSHYARICYNLFIGNKYTMANELNFSLVFANNGDIFGVSSFDFMVLCHFKFSILLVLMKIIKFKGLFGFCIYFLFSEIFFHLVSVFLFQGFVEETKKTVFYTKQYITS